MAITSYFYGQLTKENFSVVQDFRYLLETLHYIIYINHKPLIVAFN